MGVNVKVKLFEILIKIRFDKSWFWKTKNMLSSFLIANKKITLRLIEPEENPAG